MLLITPGHPGTTRHLRKASNMKDRLTYMNRKKKKEINENRYIE
jgi:hypothetical protein